MCEDPSSRGKATAGGQDALSALLVLKGGSDAARKGTGQLALNMERLLHAVDLGIDMRSLLVDPWLALSYACNQLRFAPVRDLLIYVWSGSRVSRPKQTLLGMAICCGQLDATRYLTDAHCEATGLTAGDLTGPIFHSTPTETNYQQECWSSSGGTLGLSPFPTSSSCRWLGGGRIAVEGLL